MKKKISICIILFVLFAIIFFFIWNYFIGEKEDIQNTENFGNMETEEVYILSGTTEKPYKYIILEDAGRLSVYYSDNVTLFMNTGIPVKSLSDELKKELGDGLRFDSEKELYDFLESYSS